MVGHLIIHDHLFKAILEGNIEDNRKQGRPRISYIQQVKEKVWRRGLSRGQTDLRKQREVALALPTRD